MSNPTANTSGPPLRDQLDARLGELRREYQLGQGQLRELSRQEAALRETLLRISGAIQVLEELLGHSAAPDRAGRQPAAEEQRAAEEQPAAAGADGQPVAPEILHVP